MNVNSFWFQFLSFEDEIFKHSQKMWQSTYILFLTSYQNRLMIILTELIVADKGRITPYKQQKCVAFKLNPIMLHNRHLTVKWGVWLTCRSCITTQLVEGGGGGIQCGRAQHTRCSPQDIQVAMHDVIKKGWAMTFFSGLLASYGWLVCYGEWLIRSLLISSDTLSEVSDTFKHACL